ncbi:MAG: UDP-N-acetylmuramate:L-alanyl-gamma-D-glutamyl-meso-diaminopimelate ligase [Thermodesulfobacteriota bacterium]|nr:UDP-N-acetylmuramate:L-alanyl-gamma-D-glutamyl-meso-diaminopimelate ligase [Thermodesulfobacteriota bacterium]
MTRLELDPKLNGLPDHIETIHLIGVCGTGMGSLAGMLVEKGYKVTGSDANVYPPMSDFLAGLGIEVAQGYAPENLDHRPDLVVVGNVVTRRNPEAPRLKELGLPYLSFPQTLRLFFLKGKSPLVVAGTHGKTTVSSLAAWLLDSADLDPGFMIGGILANYGRNFRLGDGEWFVVEGDEYDTAFFDKVPKFIHYAPRVGILTSVEFDHADIYPDFKAVKAAFERFVALIPKDGLLVAWGDDPIVRDMAPKAAAPVVFYGLGRQNDWRAVNLAAKGRRVLFDLIRQGHEPEPIFSPLPGTHNVLNTLAVAAALDRIGLNPGRLGPGLETFKGVRRRQEVRGVEAGVTVIDDFAHHPTAVRETLAAIRAAYPGQRIAAAFEPRTNTSRRNIFQADYAAAFDDADKVLVRQPPDLAKVPKKERFSSKQLVQDLRDRGKSAFFFQDANLLLDHLLAETRPGDVVLIMSNGGFDNLHDRLLKGLKNEINQG